MVNIFVPDVNWTYIRRSYGAIWILIYADLNLNSATGTAIVLWNICHLGWHWRMRKDAKKIQTVKIGNYIDEKKKWYFERSKCWSRRRKKLRKWKTSFFAIAVS